MSHIITCPRCSSQLRVSEQITDKTMICPHCLADVDNPWPGSHIQAVDINTDVKRNLSVSSIVLIALMGLSLLGVGMGSSFASFLFYGLIAVFVIIQIIRSLTPGSASNAPISTTKSVFHTLFLVLGTIVAVVIFAFFACAIAISNMKLGK